MKIKRIMFLLTALMFVIPAYCNEKLPVYTAYRISSHAGLENFFQDKCWSALPEATGFRILSASYALAERQTSFRIGWDDSNLYILIRCEEPEIADISAKLKDGEAVYLDDSLEIFLSPELPDYQQFVVNAAGSRLWIQNSNLEWQTAVYTDETSWSCAIMIPFRILNGSPLDNTEWRINIARNVRVPSGIKERHTTWAPLDGRFADIEHFGTLVFSGKTLSSGEAGRIALREKKEVVAPLVKRTVEMIMSREREIKAIPDRSVRAGLEKRLDAMKKQLASTDISIRETLMIKKNADILFNEAAEIMLKLLLD